MTLKEKFLQYTPVEFEEEYAEKCEKIADEYAIDYAEWCCARAIGVTHFKLNEEELEQFKKEKGL